MNHTLKAFIISFIIHASLFGTFLELQKPEPKKKEMIILSMNMIHEMTQIKQENRPKEQVTTKEQKKQEKKKEIKPIKAQPKPKPQPKKITPKKIEKEIQKKEPPKKEELKKSVLQEKKEEQIKRVKSGESYQQQYLKNNLASIIAAIKKHKKYPYKAKKHNMEGKVLIECTITNNGKLKNIHILEASKFTLLNENSIEILRIASKEFESPKQEVTLTIPFNYYLN
ncbi:MAG: energy transducer TonB [Candidatus Marinarcus sp.]|uniref:energy transducer TonB n=1 Tax=Candidatus Marinarcus sp. TaxID=3100987 RepID=UPI003B000E53